MVIDLGHGIAVAGPFPAYPVRIQNAGIRPGKVVLHPGQKGRAEIKIYPFITIYDLPDVSLSVQYAGKSQGIVTFPGYPLVPVQKGSGTGFGQNILQPGILARRLIKMSVNTNRAVHGSTPRSLNIPEN
jgi:hypothetical protein